MENPFAIEFDFPLEYTAIRIQLRAIAESIAPSSYLVHSICHSSASVDGACLLPEQKIKYIDRDGHKSWVHMDSEKETELSLAMGKAIEKQGDRIH